MRQVCHSLAEAHARGLVHRDVTPANIYVCRMGLDYDFVKVLDFGLVSHTKQRAMENTLLTGAHTTTGTPAFMAPEIILEAQVDESADVYALGCVMYYLLTGQLLFEGDSPIKMFVQHLQAPPIPPSQRTELPIPVAARPSWRLERVRRSLASPRSPSGAACSRRTSRSPARRGCRGARGS